MPKQAENKLLEKWPKISAKLSETCRLFNADKSFATMWPKDVEKFLMLLKLLPSIACGCSTEAEGIATFNRSVDKLIMFQKVRSVKFPEYIWIIIILFFDFFLPIQIGKAPMKSLSGNKFPYIMAYGQTNAKIEYYFIVVEQKNMIAVCVPIRHNNNDIQRHISCIFRCHTNLTSHKQLICSSKYTLFSTITSSPA